MRAVTWVLDCDGVIWLGDEVIEGAPEAVSRIRSAGVSAVFLTNNSYARRRDHVDKLARMGIEARPEDVLTSAMAAARLLEAGELALVLGGPGVIEELEAAGVEVLRPGERSARAPGVVVVGFDPEFDFASLSAATSALRAGARLVATNDDATYPIRGGVLPGAGSLVSAVATAGGAVPSVAGKPNEATVGLLREQVAEVSMVVGDRPSTDGVLAGRLGSRFGLVLTGVTPGDHGPLSPAPSVEADDILALVKAELGG